MTYSYRLIAMLLLVAILAGVVGGNGFGPDVEAIQALLGWRMAHPAATHGVIALTQLGSAYATLGSGIAAVVWLAWRRQRDRSILLAVTVAAERLLLDGSKYLIGRTRPAFDLHPVTVTSTSFPSGHAGNSMAVYLAIALIATPPRWRTPAVIFAVALSVAIGLTRPYLGVHWPSDVVGGWALGAAVAILAATIAEQRVSGAAEAQHEVVGGH